MVFIKIISKSKDTVLGVEELSEPCFVKWQEKNNIHIRCDEKSALGIVSGDGSTTYQLKGKPTLPDCDAEMYAEIIDEYDYEFYRNQIGDGGEVTEPAEAEQSEEGESEEILTPERLKARVLELEEQVNMLTGCILEMSEAVYG